MPRRNTIRYDAPESFYHVYARGNSKKRIFIDEQDYLMFLHLLARYLSLDEAKDAYGVPYPNFYNRIDLAAYCLMPNHFHLLVYQREAGTLAALMRSVMASYSRYFNNKNSRTGPLFESRYRASYIETDEYLHHISRYIHLNPRQWKNYEYSSLSYYLQHNQDTWLRPDRIIELFETPESYLEFVSDYQENKKMIDILKHELASL